MALFVIPLCLVIFLLCRGDLLLFVGIHFFKMRLCLCHAVSQLQLTGVQFLLSLLNESLALGFKVIYLYSYGFSLLWNHVQLSLGNRLLLSEFLHFRTKLMFQVPDGFLPFLLQSIQLSLYTIPFVFQCHLLFLQLLGLPYVKRKVGKVQSHSIQ